MTHPGSEDFKKQTNKKTKYGDLRMLCFNENPPVPMNTSLALFHSDALYSSRSFWFNV